MKLIRLFKPATNVGDDNIGYGDYNIVIAKKN